MMPLIRNDILVACILKSISSYILFTSSTAICFHRFYLMVKIDDRNLQMKKMEGSLPFVGNIKANL